MNATHAERTSMYAKTLCITACAAAAAITPCLSAAADTGTVTATVTVAPPVLRSVTVTPTSTSFGTCIDNTKTPAAGMTYPNGICTTSQTTPITVTNGAAPGHIDVQASNAVASDNTGSWTLCGYAGTTCTAGVDQPGPDQYELEVLPANNNSVEAPVGPQPFCDSAFDEADPVAPGGGCNASAHQVENEYLHLVGPTTSSDATTTWQTAITWTAVP